MAQINLRIDDKLKQNAELVLNDIGLNMSTAFTLFLKTVVRENRIPFELTADPFYSQENLAELERRINAFKTGRSKLIEHDLIEE